MSWNRLVTFPAPAGSVSRPPRTELCKRARRTVQVPARAVSFPPAAISNPPIAHGEAVRSLSRLAGHHRYGPPADALPTLAADEVRGRSGQDPLALSQDERARPQVRQRRLRPAIARAAQRAGQGHALPDRHAPQGRVRRLAGPGRNQQVAASTRWKRSWSAARSSTPPAWKKPATWPRRSTSKFATPSCSKSWPAPTS